MTPSPLLRSPEDASLCLNAKIITPSWLKEMARRREIPFVLIAGKYAFTDKHLDEIIRQFEVTPRGEQHSTAPRRAAPENGQPAVTQLRARPPQRRRSA